MLVTLLEPGSAELRDELRRSKAALEQHGHVISHDFRAPLRMLEQMSKILVADHAEHLPPRATSLLNHVASGAAKLAAASRTADALRYAQRSTAASAAGRCRRDDRQDRRGVACRDA